MIRKMKGRITKSMGKMTDELKILEREVATISGAKILRIEYTDSDKDVVAFELKDYYGFILTRNQAIRMLDNIRNRILRKKNETKSKN